MPDFDNFKFYELRSLAQELHISVEAVRKHGDLRLRQTWISAIKAANAPLLDEDSTCGQNVHKFTAIQNEVGFVDGQLAANGVPLPQARTVASLAETGRWAEAFQAVRGNELATRILSRIREVVVA